ncbi:MAG TPA: 4Fe-4S dicluster domain-containing protein [Candidatus Deferrimicrobium sp.]|nr:4Fe-4S dicluster domain-containing protein [Candidatus Deferrimicrobium sp.]
MSNNKSAEIIINEDRCAGCRICQLICSFTYQQIFALDKAYIHIQTEEMFPKISFLEGCTHCYQCVKHCLYGALELKEGDA